MTLLAVPNTHDSIPNLNRNAQLLQEMMKKRGLATSLWNTSGGVPFVFGEKKVPGATHTILFYAHYDGQPVDAKRWSQENPFVPVVRTGPLENGVELAPAVAGNAFANDWRIYARGAADDKVSIIALLAALDALGRKAQIEHQGHPAWRGGTVRSGLERDHSGPIPTV